MKRFLVLMVCLSFLTVMAIAENHPLVGDWEMDIYIKDNIFVDIITITSVNTMTNKVEGHDSYCPEIKYRGYINDDSVFLGDVLEGIYWDGFFFPIPGKNKNGVIKHLGVFQYGRYLEMKAEWHKLEVIKLKEIPFIILENNYQNLLKLQAEESKEKERKP